MGSSSGGFSLSSINPYAKAAQAGIQAFQAGTGAYFQTKTAKAQARAQAAQMGIQADLSRAVSKYQAGSYRDQGNVLRSNAEVVLANKSVQDIENRQQLAQMGRQQSALTAGYRDLQAGNTAQAGAGNVDITSGSVAAVAEGNARRYADESAAMRRAYDLQRWNGESTLSMMDVQARGLRNMAGAYDTMASATEFYGDRMGAAYDVMGSAYRTVARLQGSAFGNAFGAAGMSLLSSFLGGSFDSLMSGSSGGQQSGGYWDRALNKQFRLQ